MTGAHQILLLEAVQLLPMSKMLMILFKVFWRWLV